MPVDRIPLGADRGRMVKMRDIEQAGDPGDLRRLLETNLVGAYELSRLAARHMEGNRGGRLIFITSMVGPQSFQGDPAYTASKGGVTALMRALAVELGPKGITANAIAAFGFEAFIAAVGDSRPAPPARAEAIDSAPIGGDVKDAERQYQLGHLLMQTHAKKKGEHWLLEAAKQGHRRAQGELAEIMIRKESLASREEGVKWLFRAAQFASRDGDVDSAIGNWGTSGHLYENTLYGRTTAADLRRSVRVRVVRDSADHDEGLETEYGAQVTVRPLGTFTRDLGVRGHNATPSAAAPTAPIAARRVIELLSLNRVRLRMRRSITPRAPNAGPGDSPCQPKRPST